MSYGSTLVVGLGEVGSALAQVLERTAPVLRQDLEPRAFAEPIGVMHICLPYRSAPAFELAVLGYIARFSPRLTIVHSTVPPGTTRRLAVRSKAAIAFSPVRGKHHRMVDDLLHYVKFVAALADRHAEAAERHLAAAGMKTARMNRPETLELAKLAETTYFGLQIAFAQELNRYAQSAGASYKEAVAFFDEIAFLPRARYFPGFIGGHCVIPNIDLLLRLRRSPLLQAILDSNERKACEPDDGQCPRNSSAQAASDDERAATLSHRR